MARFINSLGYKEITLKSDTELAKIAFRNGVAENCKAEGHVGTDWLSKSRGESLMASGLDRPRMQIDSWPPSPVPFEGARLQRERITRADIEAFGTNAGCPGCNVIRSGKRAQAHSDPCRVRIEERLKMTPEGAERLERRSEV